MKNNILPKRYILACNHEKKIDGFIIYCYFLFFYNTKLAIFAHEKYYTKWWSKYFLTFVNCIKVPYINPGICLKKATKEKKRSFLIFIEGKIVNVRGKAKTGCIRLAKLCNLPIYPIRIDGINIKIGENFKNLDSNLKIASEELLDCIYSL